MSVPTISEYLSYAHLQMAAEAFIRDEKTNQLNNEGLPLREGLQNPIRQTSAVRRRARARLMPAQSVDSGQVAPVWRLVSALAAPPWRPADAPIPAVP
jgi:hypothetical protein